MSEQKGQSEDCCDVGRPVTTDRRTPAGSDTARPDYPPFHPAAGLSNGHVQTIVSAFRPARPAVAGTVCRQLRLPDDDTIVLHDNQPESWTHGDHVVLLMHGLAGCHQSGYMVRICAKLLQRNVRVFRMDHRGCGAGQSLARNPYHAGRIEDVDAAIRMLEHLCPDSPVSVAGFSLSGNLLLRYLGDRPQTLPISLFRAVAVCPPINLHDCVKRLGASGMGRRYDRYFARQLVSRIRNTPLWSDQLPLAGAKKPPERLIDFDELYTAPASGFASATDYYDFASAENYLSKIHVHTSILTSHDDPLVSPTPWQGVSLPPNIALSMTRHGGHLGFIGRRGTDPDNRWMDWRVVEWLLN